ncbi:MAG: D-alanine--D-alanine ligase [Lachnospiraceae bacterium]|nr:D-alanine--D-alanine ligase [Lachnospiraceae bacterium]
MNIVVLAGGISTERDVSLASGKMIYNAVKKKGHNAILLDVFLGYEGEDTAHLFELEEDWAAQISGVGETSPDIEQIKALRPDWKKNFFGPNVVTICQQADVVFMALHGENGENGKIQAYFDLMGITYTGTDYVSSAICMDKGITKDLFVKYGIPAPKGIRIKKGEKETERVPFPCIVKASCGGSSVGVTIAEEEAGYERAKAEGYKYDDEIIIEQYIEGREFSVGVLDGKALPIIEIAPLCGFYDYKNKYQAGSTVETCPAKLPPEKTDEMQHYAEEAFRILRLKNYARMDFMMGKDGAVYCLEANTLPGMTPTSLLPQEAAAIGLSFEDLCERLIEISLRDKDQ